MGEDKGDGDEVRHWYRRVSRARIGIWLDSRLAVLAPVILWCVLARRSRSTFLLQLGLERPRSLPTRLTATPVHQPLRGASPSPTRAKAAGALGLSEQTP